MADADDKAGLTLSRSCSIEPNLSSSAKRIAVALVVERVAVVECACHVYELRPFGRSR
jgi:hypothetical protein